MSFKGIKPLQYISTFFNSAMHRKARRELTIQGNPNAQMTLFEHIQDLRKHALKGALWIFAFSGVSFLFMDPVISFLKKPYEQFLIVSKTKGLPENLSSIGVFEVMTMNFKICFMVGFALSIPFLMREMWKFIAPALYKKEKKFALWALLSSMFLFYAGLSFGFFLIIPYFIQEALGWTSRYAMVMITYESYFNSLITMLLIFAAVFEVPVILTLLGLVGVLPSVTLEKNRKIAFLSCFIIGAILSPPEVISLCMVALPMYFMVEVSIFIIKKIEQGRIHTT